MYRRSYVKFQAQNWLFLAGLMSLCLFSHGYVAWKYSALFPDATQYVSLAQNLTDTGHYTSNGGHFPDVIQPPLFPFLIALVYHLLQSAFVSGWVVTILCRALTVIPLFYLSKRLFDITTARMAVILCLIHPLLFRHSILISSESAFGLVFLTTIWLWFIFLEKWKMTQASVLGLLSGLAYCIRIEGVLLLPIFWGLVSLAKTRPGHAKLKANLIFSAVFLLVFGTATYWIHLQSGQWQLLPKLRLIMIHKKIWRTAQSQPGFNQLPESLQYEQVVFKYAPEQRELLANILFKPRRDQSKPAPPNLNAGTQPHRVQKKLLLLRELTFGSIRTYLNNLKILGQNLQYPEFFPGILFPLLILGLLRKYPKRRRFATNLQLGLIGFVFSLFMASHFELRFLWSIIHLTLIWCAGGLAFCADLIQNQARRLISNFNGKYVTGGLILLVILLILPTWLPIIKFNQALRASQSREVACIQQHIPSAARIIARSPVSAYLSGRSYAPLPYVQFEQLLDYSKKFQECSLWLTNSDATLRPELAADLARLLANPAQTKAYHIISTNCGTIVNFNWNSE